MKSILVRQLTRAAASACPPPALASTSSDYLYLCHIHIHLPSRSTMAAPTMPSSDLNSRKPGLVTDPHSLDPARTPLPLTASQEAQVRELYYKRVRTRCADEVRGTCCIPLPPITKQTLNTASVDFAACCSSRTFSATFMCRTQQKAMNACMNRFATREEQDAARQEWFATLDKRKEEKEVKDKKRREDEKFWREWWDKDKQTQELPETDWKPKDRKRR